MKFRPWGISTWQYLILYGTAAARHYVCRCLADGSHPSAISAALGRLLLFFHLPNWVIIITLYDWLAWDILVYFYCSIISNFSSLDLGCSETLPLSATFQILMHVWIFYCRTSLFLQSPAVINTMDSEIERKERLLSINHDDSDDEDEGKATQSFVFRKRINSRWPHLLFASLIISNALTFVFTNLSWKKNFDSLCSFHTSQSWSKSTQFHFLGNIKMFTPVF